MNGARLWGKAVRINSRFALVALVTGSAVLGICGGVSALEIQVNGSAGLAQVGGGTWGQLTAGARVRKSAFDLSLRAPLRTSARTPERLRSRDWDDVGEWMRLVPKIAWQRPTAAGQLTSLSIVVAPTAGATLGHGTLIRGYRSALLPDHFQSGLRVELDGDAVGLQLMTGDVARFDLVALRLFSRPLSRGRKRRGLLRSLRGFTVGISAAADRQAPLDVATNPDGSLRHHANGRPVVTTSPLVLAGVDLGLPLAIGRRQHLVPYADLNLASTNGGGGVGLHAGLWWAYQGANTVRFRWEARRSQGSYRPGWIDGFYALERTQLGSVGTTKAAAWAARSGQRHWSHLLEAQFQTPAGWQVGASWELWHAADDRPDDTASARLTTPVWRGAQATLAWAMRPGIGQQTFAASMRWQSEGPWHAWINSQRIWHADEGAYALTVDAAMGVGARWAW
ncbi:MAG: hypothetical protein KC502_06640 [Myxococcales bacterium]|nr:hypothetical protein [Myxococcales bacterium]